MTTERKDSGAVPQGASARGLEPHPEGGWYRRTWTSPVEVSTPNGPRPAATLIEFLLPPGEFSAWHNVANDEIWMWHGPDALTLELGGDGDAPTQDVVTYILGPDLDAGQVVQACVPGGVWQRTAPSTGTCLVSCLVSPGFSFDDFALQNPPAKDRV